MHRFREKLKTGYSGPKMEQFGHHKNFPQKVGSIIFMYLLNPNIIQKIRKKSNGPILRKSCTDGRTELNSSITFEVM